MSSPHNGGLRKATKPKNTKKLIVEPLVFFAVFLLFFGYLAYRMDIRNMMNTMMATAHDLLINTVFFLMGITVLMGAFSKLLAEFGVVDLLEKLLRPLMRPVFNLPGVAALGAVVTFLSDNPAIIILSKNARFAQHFRKYQLVSLTNFGTTWGMGLIVVVFMLSQGYGGPAMVGVFGAFCGCIISTRLMQRLTLKQFPEYDCPAVVVSGETDGEEPKDEVEESEQSGFMRFLNAALDGGRQGVDLGIAIIPGVLIISTVVMMLTFNTTEFTGKAYEGVGLLPKVANCISFVFEWLFGFTNTELLAFPMTALGAVGAALGLIPQMKASGILDANAVAVFTAIGMCWSGYLSTHAAMLDSMGYRQLISKAVAAHTIAGICAGVVAHWAYVLVSLL